LFAFGTAVNAIPYYLVPGSSALGGPNRVIVIFCFSAAMLAGFGAQWFVQRAQEDYPSTKRKIGWRALVVACAIFVAAFLSSQFVATAGLSQLGLDSSKVMSMNFGQYLSFASTLIAGLGVLALYTAGFLPKPLFAALALAVIVADLFSFGIGFNPNVPVSQVYPETSLIRWIKRDAPDTRLMPINDRWSLYTSPDAVLPPNAAMVYGFYDMQGYDSLFPKRYKDFVNDHLGADSSPVENGNILFIKKLVSNWPQGTAGVVLSKGPVSGKGISSVSQLDGVRVYDYANYESTYLLPHVGRAWIADRNTNEVDVNVDTDNPSRLILAEAYYPGWQAEANGAPKPVFVAQQVFRSVDLPPGSSTVKFRFLPGTYVVGAFLGLLGAVAAGIAIGIAIGRRWQS
jgi:hypothetical protein